MLDYISPIFSGQSDWLQSIAPPVLSAAIAVMGALIAHWLVFRLLFRIAEASESRADNILVKRLVTPTRWSVVALAIVLVAREFPQIGVAWDKAAGFLIPALVGWMALAVLYALTETMALKADISVEDNLLARQRRTRLAIFGRIGAFIIVFITVGLMLLSIPGVRDVGITLMASAGLAGLAVGAAAQPALKSMIGGLQMALTEPIALDDVVIIGGEWGRVEEIRMTYVVVKVWDLRRLIVPTSKFLEEIFQNWTKTSSDLIGTVFLYLDPATDVSALREEFEQQVRQHKLWNGFAHNVKVTDASADAMEVRLLMSAKDSSQLFDLRCDIRETMMDYVRREMPEAIVRRRLVSPQPLMVTQNDGGSEAPA